MLTILEAFGRQSLVAIFLKHLAALVQTNRYVACLFDEGSMDRLWNLSRSQFLATLGSFFVTIPGNGLPQYASTRFRLPQVKGSSSLSDTLNFTTKLELRSEPEGGVTQLVEYKQLLVPNWNSKLPHFLLESPNQATLAHPVAKLLLDYYWKHVQAYSRVSSAALNLY